ncbi:OBAP family protein [Pseudomonas sp. LP_7_YM]|uniref:OBAP family protein n=1 Tax=Pseudomonas sp. LP_7_YM TaxID=2485137 RepID=UPI002114D675|nr:OBAP family protein [Pseudomonas sp. LP_7_YM]
MHPSEQRTVIKLPLTILAAVAIAGCAGNNSVSNVNAPGAPEKASTKALEVGADMLQSRPPIDALNAYLDGFHFYNGHLHSQMEAHHYCSILNEEVIQCVIYDGNVKDAKLMGVEYIISEPLFAKLPPTEKALWHSHVHEVKSGQLIAPGIPEPAEHALMDKLVHTYGKTWHTWHTDLDKDLPLGVPQLMMGFTADGQVDATLVQKRDKRFGIDSAEKEKNRADIPTPTVDNGADAWSKGNTFQIKDPTGSHTH